MTSTRVPLIGGKPMTLQREAVLQAQLVELARRGITGRAARRILQRELRTGRL